MRFTFDREWLQKNADRDDKLEIAAGSFSLDQIPPTGVSADCPAVAAFGRLVSLSRRQRGWTLEDLASSARIDLVEAVRIEHDEAYVPGPQSVYQLSSALGLPGDLMMQLSGNLIVGDRRLGEQAVKFAARSESVEKLSLQEHSALEEFVKYLNEPG